MLERAMRSLTAITAIGAVAVLAAPGCGDGGTTFVEGSSGGNGGGDGGDLLGGGDASDAKACTGLCLRQKNCANGTQTSLSGSVYDPAGRVPLYNVVVYVPNAPLSDIKDGASCDQCGTVSGDPLVVALTDSAGNFKLQNVPVGKDIPLVMQVGKWRRQVTLPMDVQECADNALTTPALKDLTRLPKNKNEGNIPLMALTTGGADALECLLRKIGVEDTEFTVGAGTGRVHFYAGHNGSTRFDPGHGGQNFGATAPFWSNADNLKKYDIVLFSCEGTSDPGSKPQAALDALGAYTSAGGRVFSSHWHRYWLWAHNDGNGSAVGNSPFTNLGAWNDHDPDPPNPINANVDTSFPKGQAMHDWLANVNALPGGTLPIRNSRHNIDSVTPPGTTSWISIDYSGLHSVQYLSFNTPQSAPDDKKCGRVVYSDLHVSADSNGDRAGQPWPQGCVTQELSPQEKALEFMLFDLSSCIQSDSKPPSIPGPK